MIIVRKLGVRARWVVPAGVVATVGIVIAASAVASAQSGSSLPARSAAQLLAELAGGTARPTGPFTATIQQTSNFGLPALPAQATQGNAASAALASGQSVSIWYLDPQHIRVAVPVQAGESDLRLDGRTLWLWNSKTQTATHVELPSHFTGLNLAGNGALSGVQKSQRSGSAPAGLPDSPMAAARQVLAAIGPITAVTVQSNVTVAGRAAYQLSLAPKSAGSLVGRILIAIDASTHIPLRVEVIARGASSPAFSVGFTALTFGRPEMSNFSFVPPPGATVRVQKVPAGLPPSLGKLGLGKLALNKLATGRLRIGKISLAKLRAAKLRQLRACKAGSGAPVRVCAPLRMMVGPAGLKLVKSRPLPKQVVRQIEQNFAKSLPKSMPSAQRAKIIKGFDRQFSKGFPAGASAVLKASSTANNGGGFWSGLPPGAIGMPVAGALPASLMLGGGKPTVIGKDWLTVIATQPSPAVAAGVKALLAGPGKGGGAVSQGPAQKSPASGPSAALAAGPAPAVLRVLLLASRPVHGKWGNGRLLTTSLVSVLITSDGRVLAGAVTPAVLYRDAAAHSG